MTPYTTLQCGLLHLPGRPMQITYYNKKANYDLFVTHSTFLGRLMQQLLINQILRKPHVIHSTSLGRLMQCYLDNDIRFSPE